MSRLLKIAAVSLVGLAFLSTFIVCCPCPEMGGAKSGEHDCCVPGLRSVGSDPCCGADLMSGKPVRAPETVACATPPAAPAAVVALVANQLEAPVVRIDSPLPFSPPLILRI